MRICVVSFTGLDTDGSDATRILKEMESLVKAGHSVTAIGLKLRDELPQNETYCGAKIFRINPSLGFDRKIQRNTKGSVLGSIGRLYTLTIKNTFATGLPLLKASWKQNADAYHLFGIYSFIPGLFLKLFKRKRVVYDAYEVPQNIMRISSLGFFAKPLSKLVGGMEILAASVMDGVLTLPSAGDEYRKRFSRWNRNVVILRNVPPANWKAERTSESEAENVDDKTLFYMGAFTKAKGIIKVLEVLNIVLKDSPNAKLLLVGSFDDAKSHDNSKVEAKEYIQHNNLSEHVSITGHIPWQDIPKYLGKANIALHLYQPLPVLIQSQGSSSFVEYMAAGLPIIASDFPGVGAIIKEHNSGITVDPTNEQEIAEAVLKLLNNPQMATELGMNSRRAFEEAFNWGVEEKKLLKMYQEFVS